MRRSPLALAVIPLTLLALACGGGEEELTVELDPVASTTEQPATRGINEDPPAGEEISRQAGTHCGEFVYFNCPVAGGKVLSVCGEEGGVIYRFGKIGELEKEYPPGMEPGEYRIEDAGTIQSQGTALAFDGDTHSFKVVERVGAGGPNGEFNNFAGVEVYKADELISSIPCTEPPHTEWERLRQVIPE